MYVLYKLGIKQKSHVTDTKHSQIPMKGFLDSQILNFTEICRVDSDKQQADKPAYLDVILSFHACCDKPRVTYKISPRKQVVSEADMTVLPVQADSIRNVI